MIFIICSIGLVLVALVGLILCVIALFKSSNKEFWYKMAHWSKE